MGSPSSRKKSTGELVEEGGFLVLPGIHQYAAQHEECHARIAAGRFGFHDQLPRAGHMLMW
jgi:hypothetical protein